MPYFFNYSIFKTTTPLEAGSSILVLKLNLLWFVKLCNYLFIKLLFVYVYISFI